MHAGLRGLRGLRGFTFVEIMVVVVIMAIAAAVVIPMVNQDSVRVPASAKMVAADLSYAQNVATTRQQRVYVLFQTSSGVITGYQVAFKENPTATADFVVRPGDVTPMTAVFGAGGTKSPLTSCSIASAKVGGTNITAMAFDAQGQPLWNNGGTYTSFAAAGTVQITSLKGTYPTDVTIQPITGLVTTPP